MHVFECGLMLGARRHNYKGKELADEAASSSFIRRGIYDPPTTRREMRDGRRETVYMNS